MKEPFRPPVAAEDRGQGAIAGSCARVAESAWFQNAVIGVILANAAVIGLETYDSIDERIGDQLTLLNEIFLVLFTVELAIRIAAYGRRPGAFFRSGWNRFDFVVVAVAYVPAVRESATLLRLARLLRVARLLSVMPGLRVVILGITRSLAPIASLSALTFFLLYVYGIIGWTWFGDYDPENFGNIGRSLLTLFQILTLEGWNEFLDAEMERYRWAWVYFVSFVLIATFVVLNIVIAIIVNSMDEVREMERLRAIEELAEETAEGRHPQEELVQRLGTLRSALEELERDLVASSLGGQRKRAD
jgi:voltage-gated sodium channel